MSALAELGVRVDYFKNYKTALKKQFFITPSEYRIQERINKLAEKKGEKDSVNLGLLCKK